MTQKDLIFSFLLKNPNARPIEISKALKIPGPSVRRAIFNLRKQKILSRPVISGKNQGTVKIRKTREARRFKELLKKLKPKRIPKEEVEEEVEEFIIYRKIVGLTLYCSRQETFFKAVIFESSKFPNRQLDLIRAIEDATESNCSQVPKQQKDEKFGYEVEEWYDEEELGVIEIVDD